jgi:UDP-N-acetylglucosamine 2-epimerase (non-hydrolysing)
MMRGSIEAPRTSQALGLQRGNYGVVTLHRPCNVDGAQTLNSLVHLLIKMAVRLPLVFPVHPRTRKQLNSASLWERLNRGIGVHLIEPAG